MLVQILNILALPSLFFIAITTQALLLSNNWRFSILSLAAQYLGVFTLVAINWPVEMAVVKVVAGWMACAVLGIAGSEASSEPSDVWQKEERAWPSSRLFRLLASSLVFLIVISLSPRLVDWLPHFSFPQAAGGTLLICMGLLHLGMTSQPLRVSVALLTALAGFEILYSVVEASALVAGLLAAVNLGIALAAAYLMLAPSMEEEKT
jgi:hypothetical protein